MKRWKLAPWVILAAGCGATVSHGPGTPGGNTADAGGVVTVDTGVPGPPVSDGGIPTPVVDGGIPTPVVDSGLPPPPPPPPGDAGMPVACPGSLAGNGLACASPGTGCGAAGGGFCTPSVSCSCGDDFRWHCTATTPDCDAGPVTGPCPGPGGSGLPCEGAGLVCGGPTPGGGSFRCDCGPDLHWACSGTGPRDAGPPPPPPPPVGDGGVCTLVGQWQATVMGLSLDFNFQADGTWQAFLGGITPGSRPVTGGTYSASAASVRLVETLGGASPTGCRPTDQGIYGLTYDPACASLTLTRLTEDCAGRGAVLGGVRLTRL